ncbi:MAG: hypothetical protein ACRC2S_04285 [Waterburya sp.]
MNNPTNIDKTRIKALFKEALVEVIEENQDLALRRETPRCNAGQRRDESR